MIYHEVLLKLKHIAAPKLEQELLEVSPAMAEKAAALVKAFFPNPSPKEWPANPEEACIKHSHFLKLWLVEKLNKKTARNAWKTACNGKLTIAEINSILNCIAEIRHFAFAKMEEHEDR